MESLSLTDFCHTSPFYLKKLSVKIQKLKEDLNIKDADVNREKDPFEEWLNQIRLKKTIK